MQAINPINTHTKFGKDRINTFPEHTVNDLFSASALVTAPYLFFPAISSVTVHNIHISFIYCTYFYLINLIFCHDFRVCFHLPPYLQEVGISKCRNTVSLPDWPKFHPGKCFMMGALKGTFFSQQILNKNRLCLAHCALNRSFTVGEILFL